MGEADRTGTISSWGGLVFFLLFLGVELVGLDVPQVVGWISLLASLLLFAVGLWRFYFRQWRIFAGGGDRRVAVSSATLAPGRDSDQVPERALMFRNTGVARFAESSAISGLVDSGWSAFHDLSLDEQNSLRSKYATNQEIMTVIDSPRGERTDPALAVEWADEGRRIRLVNSGERIDGVEVYASGFASWNQERSQYLDTGMRRYRLYGPKPLEPKGHGRGDDQRVLVIGHGKGFYLRDTPDKHEFPDGTWKVTVELQVGGFVVTRSTLCFGWSNMAARVVDCPG